jgi:hypothetical protein
VALTSPVRLCSMRAMRYLLSSSLLLAACGGPTFDSVCDRAKDECGLPDAAYTQCKESAERATDAADQLDCDSELDDYIACVDGQDPFCAASFNEVCLTELATLNQCGAVQGEPDPPG